MLDIVYLSGRDVLITVPYWVFFRIVLFFFFFKQKTAYEMLRSLVGSEMCIRDSAWTAASASRILEKPSGKCPASICQTECASDQPMSCLLYTSDAADDLLCVDLGGRRIIKKKTTCTQKTHISMTNYT